MKKLYIGFIRNCKTKESHQNMNIGDRHICSTLFKPQVWFNIDRSIDKLYIKMIFIGL